MSITKLFTFSMIFGTLHFAPSSLSAQDEANVTLATATNIKCTFSIIAISTWTDGQPQVEVNPISLEMEFEAVNTDEGTAQLSSGIGNYDIIVRYAEGYLHFVQSFRDGPLYSTTVTEKETSEGKLLAMHSRHEYTDYRLSGFTSSPEQYYGECELLG